LEIGYCLYFVLVYELFVSGFVTADSYELLNLCNLAVEIPACRQAGV